MKKLFNRNQETYNNENFAENWLYFSNGPEGKVPVVPEKEENIEQKINKALKNPLSFGEKELKFLEKNQDKMTVFQERRFRNLAGYVLSLSRGKDMDALPPRMLTLLTDSPLRKLLPKRMFNQIVTEVDSQMKALGTILEKSVDSWSTFELSKVCVLYRRLRKSAVSVDGSRSRLFEDARKKIITKTFSLMTKPAGKTAKDKVNETIAGGKVEVMTLQEKLLVMEVRRMFPYENSWAEKSKFYDWDQIAVDAIKEAFADPANLTNPNMAFTWELLRSFLGENPGTDNAVLLKQKILNAVSNEDIEKYFNTTEAIKFLQFAKNNRVFLPTHLQVLQQILDEKIKFTKLEDIKDWEVYEEKGEDLKKLGEKLKDLNKKRAKYEGKGLDEYIDLSPDEQKEEINKWDDSGLVNVNEIPGIIKKYEEFRGNRTEEVNKVWENKFSSWIEKAEKIWGGEKNEDNSGDTKIISLYDKRTAELNLEEAQEIIKVLGKNEVGITNGKISFSSENKIVLKKKIEQIFPRGEVEDMKATVDALFKADEEGDKNKRSEHQEVIEEAFKSKRADLENIKIKLKELKDAIGTISDMEKREDAIEEFREIFNNKMGKGVQEEKEFKVFDKEYKEYINKHSKWKDEEKKVIQQLPLSESIQKEISKIKEKESKLKEEITKKTKEMDSYILWGELLKNPKKVAEAAEVTFISNLKDRIENKNLYAADFEVLWGDEIRDPENDFYEENAKFREKLEGLPKKEEIEEFRGKFHDILGGIFDEVELSTLEDGEDKFVPWYRELNKALNYEKIISRLKEEGFDLREKFESPQQITQLIDGAVRSYRDYIFEVVMSKVDELDSEEEKEFFAGWDRLHGGLDGATDPTKVHQKFVSYEQNKLRTSAVVKNSEEVNNSYVEQLKKKAEAEQNPAKKQHYLDEAEKLEESFSIRKSAYQNGGNFWGKDKEGKDKQYWSPGKDLLNELDLQTQSITKEISKITGDLRNEIAEIADTFKGISKISDSVDKRIKQARAKDKLQNLFEKWPEIRENLYGEIGDMKTVMLEVVPKGVTPDKFIDVYLDMPIRMIRAFNETFDDLKKEAGKVNYEFTGNEAFWKIFADNFIKLESALDFHNGNFAKDAENLDKYMKEADHTLEFLTNLQFFDDNTPEKDEFTKNYEERASQFKEDFIKYQNTINDVNVRLRRDISSLNDKSFFEKYGLEKSYMSDMVANHVNTSRQFKEMSEKFMKRGFLSDWIHRYDSSPQARAEAIAEMGDFRSLKEHAKNAGEYAENMQKWVREYDDNSSQKSQKTYQKFSLYDLYAIVKQAIEVNERRWKRDSDRAVANIGMSFFGAESAWGKEFKQKSEESEEARVKEFETQYGEYPGWDIQEALYKTDDADEAKACVRLLLTSGFMQWDDPGFWRTLMRLSNNAVKFRIPEDRNLSQAEILEKVRNACEFIWSKETFRQWDTEFGGKLKSAIDGHSAEFGRYENDKNARTRIMGTMLKRWKNGDVTNVDPAKYECFIRESFTKGKMNGQPDQRWYFMIMGVATINPNTGKSLLSRDVFMRMNDEFLARFPHVDFLADKSSPKLDGRIVPEGTPGSKPREWTMDDYIKWGEFLSDGNGTFDPRDGITAEKTKRFFYHVVHMSPYARDRVQRMDRFADKEGDHDDAESFFAEWGQTQVADHLSKESSGKNKSSSDFWKTYLKGFTPYMEYMKKYIEEGDSKWGDAEFWKKEKTRVLLEVGDRLKAAVTVTQTLQGNGNKGEKRGSIVFESELWRKKTTDYSQSALESRNTINKFMKGVFENSDGGEDVKDILDFMGVEEYGISWEGGRQVKLKEKGILQKFDKLVDSKESRELYFENTDAIEKVLKNWNVDSSSKIINVDFGGDIGLAA